MKKLLIIPAILIVSVAMGQSKTIETASTANSKLLVGTSTNLVPSYFTINSRANKSWLTISGKPTWNNPDTIIITVRKSQIRWLNDSTLIVTK